MGKRGAMERRYRPRPDPKLEGWPPAYYCWACHRYSFGADDLRRNHDCDECLIALALFERMWAAMRPKKASDP